jgi:hypothetical protein
MANPEHVAKLKEGVDAWNRWREENPAGKPDFSGADITLADLDGVNLTEAVLWDTKFPDTLRAAKLMKADFRGSRLINKDLGLADLSGACLTGVDLIGADLTKAVLVGASLNMANLFSANLRGADLRGANLQQANLHAVNMAGASLIGTNLVSGQFEATNLERADLSGARLGYTVFLDTDLSTAQGLDAVKHGGPSHIGIDTVFKSKGKIPLGFLRGAGVPEIFITYLESLVSAGIEFYSLFISYASADQAFAEKLHANLQDSGVRCWFAPRDIHGGSRIDEQLHEAIRIHDKVLLILSPASMASKWVHWELANARKLEVAEGRRVLFPIRLCSYEALNEWVCVDPERGEDLAAEIRRYFIPDFSNWTDPASYRPAFDRLLTDLHGKPQPS